MNDNAKIPQNLSKLMQIADEMQPSTATTSYASFLDSVTASRRKKVLAVVLLLASPYLYSFLDRRFRSSQIYREHRQRHDSFTTHLQAVESMESLEKQRNKKPAVDASFMRKLAFLLKIVIPGWHSKEMGMLTMHSFFLILRTYLSVVVARIDGLIVKHLVAGNAKEFVKGLGYWFAIAVPATYTNSMIRYLQSKLAIAFRTRLTRHVHDLYLDQIVYYKVLNLDSRIGSGADQLICTDIARFCDTLSSLYSNLAKPVLDTVIFNYQLTKSIGYAGMVALFVNYTITARILRAVTPGFGKLAAVEAKLEGDFRAAHSRLITNAEEIAFYHGDDRELGILDRSYRTLIRHVNRIYRIRIAYNMFEDFVIKYSWSAVGLLVASVPVFFPSWAGSRERRSLVAGSNSAVEDLESIGSAVAAIDSSAVTGSVEAGAKSSHGSRTEGFITNKRLMISLADAGGRIMYSFKEMAELAGFTSRVHELLSVFDDLKNEHYEKEMIGETDLSRYKFSLKNIQGILEEGYDGIKMTHVPVVTPSGEVLINDLSFELKAGMHILITGPNGVGKSAIMRIIAGMWPVFRGEVDRPIAREIIYIPQRAYLSLGTLRDQVIYPHSHQDMLTLTDFTDDDLMEVLKIVHLDYLPEREGGWDAEKEWKDVLSGGEKQRMNLARMFYHRPKFAVLDECTSAVSTDVEGLMYSRAKDMGISLLTISHRPSLLKHHSFLLRINGASHPEEWQWSSLTQEAARMNVDKEMAQLKSRIQEEDTLRKRLTDINHQLGVKVNATKK